MRVVHKPGPDEAEIGRILSAWMDGVTIYQISQRFKRGSTAIKKIIADKMWCNPTSVTSVWGLWKDYKPRP